MNYTKYTLERLLLGLKRSRQGKLLEKKFAMSYFRQDPSLTSVRDHVLLIREISTDIESKCVLEVGCIRVEVLPAT